MTANYKDKMKNEEFNFDDYKNQSDNTPSMAKVNPTTGHPYNYDYFSEPLIINRAISSGQPIIYNNFAEYAYSTTFHKLAETNDPDFLALIAKCWIATKLAQKGIDPKKANLKKELSYFLKRKEALLN